MRKIVVNNKYNEKKLIDFLLDSFNGLKLNTIYKTLRKKDILINNIRVNKNVTLNTNDEITLYISDEFLFNTIDIHIVYEDDNILIVNKPISLEVIGDNSLTTMLLQQHNFTFLEPCHRLDRNTCGLILYAKNKDSLDILFEKFKNGEIEKHYLCIVYGIPKKHQDTLEAYLFKDAKKSIVFISDIPKTGYQKIITKYEIINTNKSNNTCTLDINLITGKTHQIRAHLAHIGYPIIGDRKIWHK